MKLWIGTLKARKRGSALGIEDFAERLINTVASAR